MQIVLYISLVFLAAYAILIEYYRRGWLSIPFFRKSENELVRTKMTVIVPARNEEKNIGNCIASLLKQEYPLSLLEIIVVNDYSTDQTENIILGFIKPGLRLINLRDYPETQKLNSYKKKAIEIGIGESMGELIVTTDADCVSGPHWLQSIALFYQQSNAAFIAAPVKIMEHPSLLSIFQILDFISLQGITAASVFKKIHTMCNGANLAYQKKIFYEVEGFKQIDSIASGDDMLLMYKIYRQYPNSLFFLKSPEAIVSTKSAAGWREFLNQRIRWASKADNYDDKRIFITLLFVYLLNCLLFVFLPAVIMDIHWLLIFILLVFIKTIIEFPFVWNVAGFFQQSKFLRYFILLQPLHIFYTIIAGWMGKFGKYEWKGRKVK